MVELPEHLKHHLTDSAGQPWAGRTFGDNPWKDDDGSAPPALAAALERFAAGEAPSADVIEALREARLLVPLVAELGEAGVTETGLTVDKSADLSIVTVAGPDGRGVVPVFSSAEAMRQWDADARPVPVEARRAALAAVEEGNELLVLDPGSAEFVVRRPAVWAIAQGEPYLEPWRDPRVVDRARAELEAEPRLAGLDLRPGDPRCRFAGPELVVVLLVADDLEPEAQQAVVAGVRERLGADAALVPLVDSLALQVQPVPAPDPAAASDPQAAPGAPGGIPEKGSAPSRRRGWFGRRRK
ncbi:MAG: SseB family protein [Microbacteriaceae bacterium]|nr:SseB family protein [Microbacteriaceae bacterium]